MKRQFLGEKYFAIAFFSIFCLTLFFVISKNLALQNFDISISEEFFNHRTLFLNYFFVIISYLGETKTIAFLCLIFLILPNRKKIGIPLTIATIFSVVINLILKLIVARQRPDGLFLTENILYYDMPNGFSFPSGHSQTACLFYFVMTFLLIKNCKVKGIFQLLLYMLCFVFCFLTCTARLYLGVHFFSDVLSGILLCFTLLICEKKLYQFYLKKNEYHILNNYK